MIFQATLETTEDGDFVASCDDPMAMVRGADAASALEKLRMEIRYRIEWCPCTGVDDDFVELEVR
jgi:uncharacterized protein YfdQ (DUF2303 family)